MLDTKARELKGKAVGRGLRPSSCGLSAVAGDCGSSQGLGPGAALAGPWKRRWRAFNKGEPSLS